MIWRETVDVLAAPDEPQRYWELVRDDTDYFFGVQYATIHQTGKRRWELHYWVGPTEVVTYHSTLREAKAMGIVGVRFNQAEQLTN